MVECNLAKVDVAGSSPVSRSTKGRSMTSAGRQQLPPTPRALLPVRRGPLSARIAMLSASGA